MVASQSVTGQFCTGCGSLEVILVKETSVDGSSSCCVGKPRARGTFTQRHSPGKPKSSGCNETRVTVDSSRLESLGRPSAQVEPSTEGIGDDLAQKCPKDLRQSSIRGGFEVLVWSASHLSSCQRPQVEISSSELLTPSSDEECAKSPRVLSGMVRRYLRDPSPLTQGERAYLSNGRKCAIVSPLGLGASLRQCDGRRRDRTQLPPSRKKGHDTRSARVRCATAQHHSTRESTQSAVHNTVTHKRDVQSRTLWRSRVAFSRVLHLPDLLPLGHCVRRERVRRQTTRPHTTSPVTKKGARHKKRACTLRLSSTPQHT